MGVGSICFEVHWSGDTGAQGQELLGALWIQHRATLAEVADYHLAVILRTSLTVASALSSFLLSFPQILARTHQAQIVIACENEDVIRQFLA